MDVLSRPLLCSDQIRLDLPFLEAIIKALVEWAPSPKGAVDINDNGCLYSNLERTGIDCIVTWNVWG